MVDVIQIVSGLAGFAPALALLFYTLREYTYPRAQKPYFDDRKIFAFFALGIVLGMVMFAFEVYGQSASTEETLIVLVLGFALMEELFKLVILNFPRFQRKVDTAFYGLSMGLGISSTFTFATVYSSLLGLEDPGALEMAAFSLLGLQLVLMHGATTAMIGVGVARGNIKPYFSEAVLVHLGYGLLMIPFFDPHPPLDIIGLAGATAVVVYAYQKVHRLSLPVLIADAKKGRKAKKIKK